MVDTFIRILQVAFGIGFVIFVHELGHFLVAKWAGIRVEVFSLGFGPRLLGFRRGDTDYRLSLVPLGGYVKMAGENPDDPRGGADDEFASKPVGARAAVISAGVIMNSIFAVVLFLVAFKIGVQMVRPIVGEVVPGSPAAAAGLQRGDEIVAIDGERPLDFVDVSLAAAFAGDDGMLVTVRRDGQVLEPVRVRPRRDTDAEFQRAGLAPIDEVAEVVEGGAADKAGLREHDIIVGLRGKRLASRAELVEAIDASPGEPLPLTVLRGGETISLTLVPAKEPARTFGFEVTERPVIDAVLPDTPAQAVGLRDGDVVVSVNGAAASSIAELKKLIAAAAGTAAKVEVERAGERATIEVKPREDGMIGVQLATRLVGEVAPGSPAAQAGIVPGSRIVGVDGEAGALAPGTADTLASRRGDQKTKIAFVTPKGERREVELVGAVVPGKFVGDAQFLPRTAEFTHRVPGLWEPIALGFDRTWMFMKQVGLTIKGMFEKRIDTRTLGGPIAIGQGAWAVASRGLGSLLYFLAVISVNLAVLNILPIPILDGGHLVFLLAEKVKGSPVSVNVQAAAQWVGLVLLLGLMLYVTKNDLVRIFGG